MQGELADTGANTTTLNNININGDMSTPSVAVQQAFSQAATGHNSQVTSAPSAASVEPIAQTNEIHIPTLGRIIEKSKNNMSITNLDGPDWATKQLLETMRPQVMSTMDRSYAYVENISNNRSDAMKDMLAIDKHLQPITDFIQESMDKNIEQLESPMEEISPAEQSRLAQESMRETAKESMIMQGLVMEANSKIVAASMNVNITVAIYRWAKELATGVVKIIKNTINNTR